MVFANEACRAPINKINWSKHELPEPEERVRELHDPEEEALFADGVMHDDLTDLVDFSLISGFRKCESAFRLEWDHCDWGNRRVQVHGKGGKVAYVPMTSVMQEILWRQRSKNNRHERLVFTREAKRDNYSLGDVKGARYPWTKSALNSAWRRARALAGLKNYRWHDHRHTAASRILRFDPSANLKTVQKILRHSNIGTTMKYAHVRDEDIVAAMEAAAAASVRRGKKSSRAEVNQ
jgi:integrase